MALAGCKAEAEAEEETGRAAVAVSYAPATLHRIEEVEHGIATLHAPRAPRIGAEVGGVLIRLTADEGSRVRENDLLAILDDSEHQLSYRRAKAELRRIDVLIEQKTREIERLERMHEGGNVPQLNLDTARAELTMVEQEHAIAASDFESAERQLARTRILAPYEGVISARHASEGDYVDAGSILFELTSYSRLQARIPLPEALADRLAEGQEVRLWRGDSDEAPLLAEVNRIAPNVDGDSRAVTGLSHVAEPPATWRAGASLRAEIVLERRNAILLPLESVVRRPGGQVVYVLRDGKAEERVVETGLRQPDWVEIRAGLVPDDAVVIDGAGFLTDGAEVDASLRDWVPRTSVIEG